MMTHARAQPGDALLDTLLAEFAAAPVCWFGSVRPDGRAHLAPIWHVWHAGCAFVVTQASAVRTRNIDHSPYVSLSLPDPMEVFILEGIARRAPERRDELQPLFFAKYAWDIATDTAYDTLIEVAPLKAIAWGNHGEGRWRFTGSWSRIEKPQSG